MNLLQNPMKTGENKVPKAPTLGGIVSCFQDFGEEFILSGIPGKKSKKSGEKSGKTFGKISEIWGNPHHPDFLDSAVFSIFSGTFPRKYILFPNPMNLFPNSGNLGIPGK